MPAEWWRVGAAALPLIALLVGLLILRWPGVRAGLVALVATLVLAATVFATSPGILAVALWRGPPPPPPPLLLPLARPLVVSGTEPPGAVHNNSAALPPPPPKTILHIVAFP